MSNAIDMDSVCQKSRRGWSRCFILLTSSHHLCLLQHQACCREPVTDITKHSPSIVIEVYLHFFFHLDPSRPRCVKVLFPDSSACFINPNRPVLDCICYYEPDSETSKDLQLKNYSMFAFYASHCISCNCINLKCKFTYDVLQVWNLVSRPNKEHQSIVFKNKVVRRTLGTKWEQVKLYWTDS
jgi:hypothetical protein